jgi:hypothetical protein
MLCLYTFFLVELPLHQTYFGLQVVISPFPGLCQGNPRLPGFISQSLPELSLMQAR